MFNFKTIIHNNNISKSKEIEFHQKTQKWLEDISKVKYCKELLNVVNQCENLNIIFDLESEQVDNSSSFISPSSGLSLTGEIKIGTKLSSTRTEQEVKGILARELCRYAIYLTYENMSFPYYKNDITAAQNINKIIESITNLTSDSSNKYDKIIASVIQTSTPDTIQMDLIATAIQILVQFDDEKEELTRFEVKFKILFDYFENFILPEMKNLNLKFRENVRKFNRTENILPRILGLELELSELKDVKSLSENNFSIIQTNFSKLLLLNIQKCLKIDQGNLFDSKNIFASSESLKSQELHDLLAQDQNLNVFVTSCGKIDENLKNIFACKTSKFTFIVSDENQCQELTQQLTELGLVPTKAEVNYSWNDLTLDSQKFLLKMKINFQNTSELSFFDILKDKFNPEDEEVVRNFTNVVDDQLLGLMIEGSDVRINAELKVEENIKFDLKERKFIKENLDKYDNYKYSYNCQSESHVESISKKELLKDVQDKKFVIISDKPGSGKTLAMKNFAHMLSMQDPTNWLSFVDLRLFSEQFKDFMIQRKENDFPEFFAETILKSKTQFEVKVFKKMYDLGKVFIFFDGLDQLTPSSIDFILKQLKDFDSNEGSQLWIATSESIEVDIEKVLKLEFKYKFEDFVVENCADLNPDLKFSPVGMPQLYKMIAEILQIDGISSIDSTELIIFRKFAQNIHKKWSVLQSSEAQSKKLDFWTLHQFMAMKSSFPNYVDFCDADFENFEFWSDEDILAGSLMTKIGQNFVFLHSTYCDFFVAEFILKTLKHEEVPSWFIQFLMKILTTRRYKCIRMFLNQGLNDGLELKLSDKTIKSITASIDEFTNISFIFTENVENLQQFLIMFLNRRRYKIVKSILVSNIDAIFITIKKSEFPLSPQILLDFLVKFLNIKCLQALIKEKKLFTTILESCEDIEHYGRFIMAVKKKIDANYVIKSFKGSRHARHPNIFFNFCWSKKVDALKIQKFIKILRGFLNVRRIMDLMIIKKKWNCTSILIDAVKRGDADVFKALWIESEEFFKYNESHRRFKELITNGASSNQTVLQSVAHSNDIKIHEAFWNLATKTFDKEELLSFINFENTSFTDYFIGNQVGHSDDAKIIEFTFERLQVIFNYEEFAGILEHKPYSGGNVLYRAAELSKNIKIFESVWNLMRKFCKNNESFVDYICRLDDNLSCILNAALRNSVHEIFHFIIYELKILTTNDKIKSLLSNINILNQNIFYSIYDIKLFSSVWNLICEYLNTSEVLEILKNLDFGGNNFIFHVYYHSYYNEELVQELWTTVKAFIIQHEINSSEVIECIEKCDDLVRNWNDYRNKNNDTVQEIIKLKWLKTKTLRLLDNPETLKLEISNSELFSCAYDFYVLANCENFEIHEICWEFILKKYENRQDLVKLMTKRSVHGSIFIHSIMSNKNIEIIKFILKIVQNNFSAPQVHELLTVKCTNNNNLLAVAVLDTKNVEIVQMLWTMCQNYLSSDEVKDLIIQDSITCENLIFQAAGSTADVFNFIWDEASKLLVLEGKVEGSQKLTELVNKRFVNYKLSNHRRNILHICVEQHDIELLKIVWNKVTNILEGSLKSIFTLTIANENGYYDWYEDILHMLESILSCEKIEFHEAFWDILWDTFKQDELRYLVLWKKEEKIEKAAEKVVSDSESSSSDDDDDDHSAYSQYSDYGKYDQDNNEPYDHNESTNLRSIFYFLQKLFQIENLGIIELTMKNFDKFLTKTEICKILKSTGYDSFLENRSESIDKHQLLWDIYRKYITLADLKDFANRLFSRALCITATISVEIFQFVWNQLIKEAENILIQALEDDAHIICECIEYKNKDLVKVVWTEVENFYKIQNLPESFKEFVMKWYYNNNTLEAASKVDELEIHEVLWELILSTFSDREELKNILVRKLEYYESLFSAIFKNKNQKVVEFLVKTLQENFTQAQLQELMKVDSNVLQNLLSNEKKNFEIFQIWWNFFKTIFSTPDMFTEFIEVNENFQTIFGNSNSQILELVFNDLKSLMSRDQIRKNLLKIKVVKYRHDENVLRVALYRGNENVSDYQFAWQYIHEYLEKQEIYDLLTQVDLDKRNFLFFVVVSYSAEIAEIAWNEMKKVLSYEDQVKFLKSKYPEYGSLYQYVSAYLYDGEKMLSWIEKIFREYKIRVNK